MTIKLNDKPYKIASGTTLATFIKDLNIELQGVAIAIDYEVIPGDQWKTTILEEGMELMMIQAVSGG
ncbi:MAG: sulfur carrier protein ThiS [Tannerella sp.]|jgi:sulfur carrier protein|nr:sulfur carrier protein ThiS [Tannerella sp.]